MFTLRLVKDELPLVLAAYHAHPDSFEWRLTHAPATYEEEDPPLNIISGSAPNKARFINIIAPYDSVAALAIASALDEKEQIAKAKAKGKVQKKADVIENKVVVHELEAAQ